MTPDETVKAWMLACRLCDAEYGTAFAQYEDLIRQGGIDRPRLEDVLRGHHGDDYIALWRGWQRRHGQP